MKTEIIFRQDKTKCFHFVFTEDAQGAEKVRNNEKMKSMLPNGMLFKKERAITTKTGQPDKVY